MLKLSSISPDYQDIRSQFQNYLGSQTAWRDLLPTGTGQTLSDFVAAVGAQDQFAIEHAFRESFRTARLDSSIVAQAILLGVRLARKSSAQCDVILQRSNVSGVFIIPPYTAFAASSARLFNRDAITFEDGVGSTTATLYEGTVISKTVTSDGSAFQMYVSPEGDFAVSDVDVQVFVNQLPQPVEPRGLWHLNGVAGIQDSTTATGQLLLTFGNTKYGTQPQISDNIQIMYVTCAGTAGQNAAASGRRISCLDFAQITGTCTTGILGGGDQKDVMLYRKLNANLFSSLTTATTEEECTAQATVYPGVLDARVFGQRKLAPSDPRWMNLIQVSLLTTAEWDGPTWNTFEAWFRQRVMFPIRFTRRDPVAVPVTVSAVVFCQGRADLSTVRSLVQANIRALFAPRPGIIDSSVYLSDIYSAIKNSDDSIEYAQLLAPTKDVITAIYAPSPLTVTATAGAGTVPAGEYAYAVTAVSTQGETLANNFTSVHVKSPSAITVTWPEVHNAVAYRVYGRGVDAGLLAYVPSTGASTYTYTDASLAQLPNEDAPIVDTAGNFWPQLIDVQLEMRYTNRQFYDVGTLK